MAAGYAPKGEVFETFGNDMTCPYCHQQQLERQEGKYGVTTGKKRNNGQFWFKYTCTNCRAVVINYTNLSI